MTKHWQPRNTKAEMADDILEWIRKVTRDERVEMTTLKKMSVRDLAVLMMATNYADDWRKGTTR